MTIKFRAWMKQYEKMDNDIGEMYFEDGEFKYIGDDVHYKRLPEHVIFMQSTDMVDRDGKIIFEGDIVKMAKDVYSEPTYYEVVRHRGGAYRLESKQHGCELWLRHADCDVVGNVYENKELLDA
jgi:uncharacterized phage protein (TIGR01671 family)